MSEIMGIIAKSVLVAVVGSAATILIDQYWGKSNRNTVNYEPPIDVEPGQPNYHF